MADAGLCTTSNLPPAAGANGSCTAPGTTSAGPTPLSTAWSSACRTTWRPSRSTSSLSSAPWKRVPPAAARTATKESSLQCRSTPPFVRLFWRPHSLPRVCPSRAGSCVAQSLRRDRRRVAAAGVGQGARQDRSRHRGPPRARPTAMQHAWRSADSRASTRPHRRAQLENLCYDCVEI